MSLLLCSGFSSAVAGDNLPCGGVREQTDVRYLGVCASVCVCVRLCVQVFVSQLGGGRRG